MKIFNLEYRDFTWWYWLATAVILTAAVFGWQNGFYWAIGLLAIDLVRFLLIDKSFKSFSVQVRLGFLAVLILFLPKPLHFLYWWPVIGLWVRLVSGYCLLARILSLLPWNRKESLSSGLIKKTFLTPPTQGSILDTIQKNQP